jgi:hypothetical protein
MTVRVSVVMMTERVGVVMVTVSGRVGVDVAVVGWL